MNSEGKQTLIIHHNWKSSKPPVFKSQRVRYQSKQKLLHHYQHSKNQPNS